MQKLTARNVYLEPVFPDFYNTIGGISGRDDIFVAITNGDSPKGFKQGCRLLVRGPTDEWVLPPTPVFTPKMVNGDL